jgi:hypothetical protein
MRQASDFRSLVIKLSSAAEISFKTMHYVNTYIGDTRMTDTANNAIPLTDAVVQLTGSNGNAYAVLGMVRRAILNSNHPELVDQFFEEATEGDYEHLLTTCCRYVMVE